MSAGLPSGTVTFLFTDIEGSTRLLRQLGDRYEHVRAEHDGILRAAANAHGGEEVDTQGDSFFFSFRRAGDAVAAAADAQRSLFGHPWPDAGALRVRIGLHTGEPTVGQDGRYVGLAVHRAARIASLARGGQVLLGSTTADLVADSLPEGTSLRDFGRHALKDFDRAEHVSQLVINGIPTEFPRVQTRSDRRTRKRVVLASAAVIIAAAIALVVALLLTGGSGMAKPITVAENSVAVIDLKTDRVVDDVPVGTSPSVVADKEGVWTMNVGDGTVSDIDPKTYRAATHPFASSISGIALGFGSVWASNPLTGTIAPIDTTYGQTGKPIRVSMPRTSDVGQGSSSPGPIATGFRSVWVGVDVPAAELVRVNPKTDAVLARIPDVYIPGVSDSAEAVAVGGGNVWVASAGDGTLLRVDPETNLVVERIQIPDYYDSATAISVGATRAWVTVPTSNEVVSIPFGSDTLESVPVGRHPTGIAVGAGSVWVSNTFDGTVSRIDPSTQKVVDTIKLGHSPASVAVGYGRVWVAVQAS